MVPKVLSGSTRALLAVAIILPALLVSGLAVAAYRTEAEVKRSSQWVTHTLEVQRAIQAVGNSLLDAETGQRGFLLTHRDEYLEPYNAGLSRVQDQLKTVRMLTADNRSQQERLNELEPLIAERLRMLASTVAQEKENDHDGALATVTSGRGKYFMDKVRGSLRVMSDEEERLLWLRQQQLSKDANGRAMVVTVLVVGALVLAVASAYLLRRLSKMAPLVTMCASTRTIEHNGEWVTFEEYLRRRFGIMITHGMSPEHVKVWQEQARQLRGEQTTARR